MARGAQPLTPPSPGLSLARPLPLPASHWLGPCAGACVAGAGSSPPEELEKVSCTTVWAGGGRRAAGRERRCRGTLPTPGRGRGWGCWARPLAGSSWPCPGCPQILRWAKTHLERITSRNWLPETDIYRLQETDFKRLTLFQGLTSRDFRRHTSRDSILKTQFQRLPETDFQRLNSRHWIPETARDLYRLTLRHSSRDWLPETSGDSLPKTKFQRLNSRDFRRLTSKY